MEKSNNVQSLSEKNAEPLKNLKNAISNAKKNCGIFSSFKKDCHALEKWAEYKIRDISSGNFTTDTKTSEPLVKSFNNLKFEIDGN